MKLLHIDSHALGAHSASRGLTAAIVAEFVAAHCGVDVASHELHAAPLRHWSLAAGDADPAGSVAGSGLEERLATDVVVVGVPIYNCGIASSLKA
jgi:FMN-dependent NADH-azoreductase